MKNALFFHRVDWDGLLSAAIVLTAKEGEEFNLFPVNYGDKLPSIEELKVYDTVYVVDFSLPREYNEQLPNILWFDHHISAIKANEGLNVRGIRDVSHSACEICWIWFMKSFLTSAPDNLLALGEYDIFEKSGRFFRWDWILAFQMGARTIPLTIESAKQFLDGTIKFNDILHAGNSILAFKREEEKIAFRCSEAFHNCVYDCYWNRIKDHKYLVAYTDTYCIGYQVINRGDDLLFDQIHTIYNGSVTTDVMQEVDKIIKPVLYELIKQIPKGSIIIDGWPEL